MAETLLQKAQRLGIQPAKKPEPSSFGQKVLDVGESVSGALGFGGATNVLGAHITRTGLFGATPEERETIEKPTALQTAGALAQVGSTLIPGAAGANLAKNIALGAATGYLYDVGANLVEGERGAGALAPGATTAIGALIPPALRGAGKLLGGIFRRGGKVAEPLLEEGKTAITEGAERIGREVLESKAVRGTTRAVKDVFERVPRFVGRVQEGLQEAAERGERIRTSTPVVQSAIKSGLDERIVNTVQQADEPTRKAYKEIIDIAEDSGKTLKPKQRPEIVAGRVAGEQYGLIEKQRKAVGVKIGEAVSQLSKTTIVPMQKTFAQLDNVLIENGITPIKGKLNFAGRFTPAERTRIQQLYTLARESGKSMTPRQVYDMDQLFSKLQRETRMEGLGDILIDTGGGKIDDILSQEARKYKSAEEFVKAQFSKKPEYGMGHRPSYEGMPPAYNLLEGDAIPKDVYTHPDFSIASGRIRRGDKAANESWNALQKIRNNPEADITVYRAGAKNELNTGDWITFSREYANQSVEGAEKVRSFKIKAKDAIFAGDDINEFGYYPKSQLTDLYNQATREQKMSMFRVFRDVFTNTLEEVAPEIRPLNKAYRNIVTLQDDIENTIIKRGKYETTKGIEGAEFAQTNLRRLDSDALSAADYRAIVEEMDAISRQLGFKGARADDLITFATEMRRLYPETVPPTGFSGGIKTGLMDIAKGVLEAGKPNIKDQQKALRELLESLLKENK